MQQVIAIAGKLLIWTISHGSHPLQKILQWKIRILSEQAHGIPDYSWVFTTIQSLPTAESSAPTNVFDAWNTLKTNLRPEDANNLQEWLSLPHWNPHSGHLWGRVMQQKSPKRKTPMQNQCIARDSSSGRSSIRQHPRQRANYVDRQTDSQTENHRARPVKLTFPRTMKSEDRAPTREEGKVCALD